MDGSRRDPTWRQRQMTRFWHALGFRTAWVAHVPPEAFALGTFVRFGVLDCLRLIASRRMHVVIVQERIDATHFRLRSDAAALPPGFETGL